MAALVANTPVTITLFAGQKLGIKDATGTYVIGPASGSNRPTVDEVLDTAGTWIGPVSADTPVTIRPTSAGTTVVYSADDGFNRQPVVYDQTTGCLFAGSALASAMNNGIQTSIGLDVPCAPDVSTAPRSATISFATPAVVTIATHGFAANQAVVFATTGALPGGLSVGVVYYVSATGLTAGTFQVSATAGGASIATTDAGSGLHTVAGVNVATQWRDISDCQNHLTASTTITAPGLNSGYITTEAGTGRTAFVPKEKLSFDMDKDSFFLCLTMKMAAPGANQAMFGWANSSTNYGLRFSVRTGTNVVVPLFNGPAGAWTNALTTVAAVLGVVADGTDHTVMYEWDAKTRTLAYRLDGELRAVWHNEFSTAGVGVNSLAFALGAESGAAGATSFVGQFKNVKFRVFQNSGLPINMGQIARSIYQTPQSMAYLNSFIFPSSYSAICWIGQSNEFGATDRPDVCGSIGAPAKDGFLSTGSTQASAPTAGSMHPAIAALGGKRNIYRQTYATALGSTSLLHYWVGQFNSWAASKSYGKGAYVIASGNVYKFTSSTAPINTVGITAGTQPTWPGSGSVVDNQITWTYVRAATAADVPGDILKETHPLFDPNGMFSTIETRIKNAPPGLVGRFVIAQSMGQSDQALGTTLAQYTELLRICIRWSLARGCKFLAGVTSSGSVAGVDTWITTVGIPARDAVLSEFAGQISPGSNSYAALGTLVVNANGVGLLDDGGGLGVHRNHFASALAAADWDKYLAAAGF